MSGSKEAKRLEEALNNYVEGTPQSKHTAKPIRIKVYIKKDPDEYLRKTEKRFAKYIRVEENGCHTWMGSLTTGGYGTFTYKSTAKRAHRVAWLLSTGEWPPPWESGLELHHLCSNPACVNVAHLALISRNLNGGMPKNRVRTRDKKAQKDQHCECCSKYKYNESTHQYEEK